MSQPMPVHDEHSEPVLPKLTQILEDVARSFDELHAKGEPAPTPRNVLRVNGFPPRTGFRWQCVFMLLQDALLLLDDAAWEKDVPLSEVHARLLTQLQERTQKGIETYGTALHTFNGRNPVQDLREELLDALQYTTQAAMESRARDMESMEDPDAE